MTDSNPTPSQDDAAVVASLIALIDVEPLEADLFRGQSADLGWSRVYGGQVVAQALMAASKTVRPERPAHSLHAYFLRPGDPQAPIVYRVERDRDGQSFTTRRVIAIQHGRPIFNMAASFQVEEGGLSHAAKPPRVPPADDLPSELEVFRRHADKFTDVQRERWLARERPFEFRSVEDARWQKTKKRTTVAHSWFRAAAAVAADPVMQRCLLAYASDMTLLDTCLLPHAIDWDDKRLQVASLDHALWFHATPKVDEWLLYAQDSPVSGGGRGLNRGLIFAADGTLLATAMQEGLIRFRADA